MLSQQQHHRSVTPISVNRLAAPADSHSPIPLSHLALSAHALQRPGPYTNFEEAGADGAGGSQRPIMDQHLFSLEGNAEPWAKLITSRVSPGGLNNI